MFDGVGRARNSQRCRRSGRRGGQNRGRAERRMTQLALSRRRSLSGQRRNGHCRGVDVGLGEAVIRIVAVRVRQRRSALGTHQHRHDQTQGQPTPIGRGCHAAMMTEQTHAQAKPLCAYDGTAI